MISTANRVLGLSMVRRRTRQWLVAGYWCVVGVPAAVLFLHRGRHSFTGFAAIVAIQMLVNLPSLLGGVRAGGAVKLYREVKWAPLLDRDDVQTVFGHATAVPESLHPGATVAKWLFPQEKATSHDPRIWVHELWNRSKPVVAGLIGPEAELDERDRVHFVAYTIARWLALALFAVYLGMGAANSQWLARIGPLFLFVPTLLLWSLPQTLILWTEPDMEVAP